MRCEPAPVPPFPITIPRGAGSLRRALIDKGPVLHRQVG